MLLSGRRPFQGDTVAELVSAILRDTPESVCELSSELPPRLGRIVQRCLEKSPDDRYQTTRDLHSDLDDLRQESETSPVVVSAASGQPVSGASDRASAPRSSSLSIPTKPSLAVLPFGNLSDDPEQDYFAAGSWGCAMFFWERCARPATRYGLPPSWSTPRPVSRSGPIDSTASWTTCLHSRMRLPSRL
jgi:serine/threonine protein kinase